MVQKTEDLNFKGTKKGKARPCYKPAEVATPPVGSSGGRHCPDIPPLVSDGNVGTAFP